MKPLLIALLALLLTACAPATMLEITKSDGTVVKFSSAKDQVVQGLSADMAAGTLQIEALESSSSKAAAAQAEREKTAAQTLLGLVGR
jgi:hypothetical protein